MEWDKWLTETSTTQVGNVNYLLTRVKIKLRPTLPVFSFCVGYRDIIFTTIIIIIIMKQHIE